MNEKDIMIEVNHMSHIYTDENGNDVHALNDVNLSIKRGEFVCIIGTNGSGKSTLAKHFNVLLQPSEGHINVCGYQQDPISVSHSLIYPMLRNISNLLSCCFFLRLPFHCT